MAAVVEVTAVDHHVAVAAEGRRLLLDRRGAFGHRNAELHRTLRKVGHGIPGVEIAAVELAGRLVEPDLGRKRLVREFRPVEGDGRRFLAERGFRFGAVTGRTAGGQESTDRVLPAVFEQGVGNDLQHGAAVLGKRRTVLHRILRRGQAVGAPAKSVAGIRRRIVDPVRHSDTGRRSGRLPVDLHHGKLRRRGQREELINDA